MLIIKNGSDISPESVKSNNPNPGFCTPVLKPFTGIDISEPEPLFKVFPESISIETIPGDEETASVWVKNLVNDSVTIIVHFIGDEDNLLANPITLWPEGNHTYFFTLTSPPKISSLDQKIVVFSGKSFGGEEQKKFVTFAIRSVEGKRHRMPCDRNWECLSGICSAFGNETKRCHELSDVENQSIDITDTKFNVTPEPEGREKCYRRRENAINVAI